MTDRRQGNDRELERLANYCENLDKGQCELNQEVGKIKATLSGDETKPLNDGGIVGEIRHLKEQARAWKKWLKWLLIICTAIGAFIADVGKDMVSEVLKKKVFHSTAQEYNEQAGKQRITHKHIRVTAHPGPPRKQITETKDKIVEDIYLDMQADAPETTEEFIK